MNHFSTTVLLLAAVCMMLIFPLVQCYPDVRKLSIPLRIKSVIVRIWQVSPPFSFAPPLPGVLCLLPVWFSSCLCACPAGRGFPISVCANSTAHLLLIIPSTLQTSLAFKLGSALQALPGLPKPQERPSSSSASLVSPESASHLPRSIYLNSNLQTFTMRSCLIQNLPQLQLPLIRCTPSVKTSSNFISASTDLPQ